ncbi:uncharacterized protein F5Z01DRAFT_695844 [Emericellopsis atlantica]|uniref:Uncharacterized protein n=1 Tax=Emericellopsis atlantica TaxID=2614577 RepID=A0A9P8CKE8_9HYPO|nr:uncharacterized protein F5Z01DRAFT_695844 [Emericellopsis atlantica]KAG9249972.1 hypothetical protein F5Z01DRAFT_695844 [Emericellopsis atlantica]
MRMIPKPSYDRAWHLRSRTARQVRAACYESRTRDCLPRTGAYLEHDADGFGEIDAERLARTLRALANHVQHDSDQKLDHSKPQAPQTVFPASTYSKRLRSRSCNIMSCIQSFKDDASHVRASESRLALNPGTAVRFSKRTRQRGAVVERLAYWRRKAELPHEEQNALATLCKAPMPIGHADKPKIVVLGSNAQGYAGDFDFRLKDEHTNFESLFYVRSLRTHALP